MKTAMEMVDERLTIQSGYFKGSMRTPTKQDIVELMEEYHTQYAKNVGLPTKIPYD